MDYQKTGEIFVQKYGMMKGLQINATVLPNIVKDFEQQLTKAPAGQTISETYRFEDITGDIVLTGCGGQITSISICGSTIHY